MKKDELKTELKKLPMIRIIGKLQLLFLLATISSPFLWIWYSGLLALKVGLTGIVGIIIFYCVDWIFKEAIKKVVDEYAEPTLKTKSKFHERLEQLAKERGQKQTDV